MAQVPEQHPHFIGCLWLDGTPGEGPREPRHRETKGNDGCRTPVTAAGDEQSREAKHHGQRQHVKNHGQRVDAITHGEMKNDAGGDRHPHGQPQPFEGRGATHEIAPAASWASASTSSSVTRQEHMKRDPPPMKL